MHNQNLVQSLEPRRLLAASFASLSSHGTLSVVGTAKNDTITISLTNGRIVAKLNSASMSFAKSSVKRIWADGFGGNDQIANNTFLPSTLLGGSGGDTLIGGTGNDQISGDSGADQLKGGGGSNLFIGADNGQIDVIDYSHSNRPISVDYVFTGGPSDAPPADARVTIGKAIDKLQGGEFGIRGTRFADSFNLSDTGNVYKAWGGAGDDSFVDVANAGEVDTTVWGEAGNDFFQMGDFDDGQRLHPFGGDGNDMYDSPAFVWDGGPGVDTSTIETSLFTTIDMRSWPGVERLVDVPSDFTSITGNDLSNYISIGEDDQDNVTIHGGLGDDTIIGGVGNDSISGDEGNDVIHGSYGNDTLAGGGGKDKLFGDDGDDLLEGRGGSKDTLDGGPGSDTASRDNGPSLFDRVLNVEKFI